MKTNPRLLSVLPLVPAFLAAGTAFAQVAPEDYPRMDWDVVYQYVYDGTLVPDFGAKAVFQRGAEQPPASSATEADFEMWLDGPVQGLEATDPEIVGADTATVSGFQEIPGSDGLGWRFAVEDLEPGAVIYPVLPAYAVISGRDGMNNLLQAGTDASVWLTETPTFFDWIETETGTGYSDERTHPGSDFDGDGLSNALEYALDLSPTLPGGSPPWQMEPDKIFAIAVRNDNPRLATGFEYSFELVEWHTLPEDDPALQRTDLGNGMAELRLTWPGPETAVFFRLWAENDELDGAPAELLPPVEPPPPVPVNVAFSKPTEQSSTFSGKISALAVDGNTDGSNAAASFNHTNSDSEAWWEVDLGEIYALADIEIWNRVNNSQRLSDFYVLLSETPFADTDLAATLADPGVTAIHTPGTADYPTTLTAPAGGWSARHVRVQLAGQDFLHMAEVVVNRVEE